MAIKLCPNCKPHEYQDKRYGQNMRVYNESVTGKKKNCTVCGKETDSSSAKK